jgi:ligand-binding sensor domain-containing protein
MNRLIPILITVILLFTVHCAFSQGIWKTYTRADGLAGDSAFCIAQDKLGNMWFGTWGAGLSKLDTNGSWTNYLGSVIYDIEIDSLNNKWLAYGKYVIKFDDSTFTYYKPAPEGYPDHCYVLGQDSLGQIWCGVYNSGGGYWFDGNVWNYCYVPGLLGNYDGVNEIKTDRFGKLYFAHSYGISTKTQFLFNVGETIDLAFDKQNRLWFGVVDWKTGLWMYDGKTLSRWNKDNGLINPLGKVYDVAIDSRNNVWIANAPYGSKFYGVSKFDGTTFTHFNVADGLSAGYVYDICVDQKGDIWFATDGGGVSVLHDTTTTSVAPLIPPVQSVQFFSLYQNYPNPFNANTCIKYDLDATGKIQLSIYNLLGKELRTLVNEHQSAGEHQINWNGTDNSGKEVSSGIYIALLNTKNFRQSIKLSLIR